MKLEAIQAAEAKLLLPTYERNPILFVDGAGMHLIDDSGARYLDLLSGIGVNALGYGHPAVVETINRQSRKLVHISNLYFHEGQAELALRLTERAGMDRAFFCNSGTEAWEAAMKLARAYSAMKRSEGHALGTKFLALENSFHGRTMGSVSTTHKDKYREPFQPLVPGVEFVRFNDVDHLRASFSNEVCAILIEPVQGEGGIGRCHRNSSRSRVSLRNRRARCSSPMRFNPAWGVPVNGLLTSNLGSGRISLRWPSRWRAGCRWAPCCVRKRRRAPFIRGCTGLRSAAGRWLVPSLSRSSMQSTRKVCWPTSGRRVRTS
jgi:hypothetical protein